MKFFKFLNNCAEFWYGLSIFCVLLLAAMNVYYALDTRDECKDKGGTYIGYECYKSVVPMEDK